MKQVLVSEELLRQVIAALDDFHTNGYRRESCYEIMKSLRAALSEASEQPAVEPVAYRYKYLNFMGEEVWRCELPRGGNVLETQPLYTAPQAQQPPRIGSGVTVEQTLEQWEHDFRNPMTHEQQADWVKRERDFAARQAQQPRKAVKLSDEELVDHYSAIADGKEWAIGGLSDAVPFARAIEQAVWEKLGVAK